VCYSRGSVRGHIGLTPGIFVTGPGFVTAGLAGAFVIGLTPGMVSAACGAAACVVPRCFFAANALDAPTARASAPMATARTDFLIMCVPFSFPLIPAVAGRARFTAGQGEGR